MLELICQFHLHPCPFKIQLCIDFNHRALNIHPHAGAFLIAAGAVLGICAGLLWTAQGSLMLAYATEDQKGKFIGIFWAIFNLGAVVGAAVPLGQNFHSTVRVSVFIHISEHLNIPSHRLTLVSLSSSTENKDFPHIKSQHTSRKWHICKSSNIALICRC